MSLPAIDFRRLREDAEDARNGMVSLRQSDVRALLGVAQAAEEARAEGWALRKLSGLTARLQRFKFPTMG